MNDESYKRLLDHRRTVKDLLLGFIARLRPPGWADSLIFDSLREGPAEYVTDDLRRRLSDVVWTIDRRAADGSVRTIQVLIEHQSSVDHSMPMRFLNYGSLMYQREVPRPPVAQGRYRRPGAARGVVQRRDPLGRAAVAGGAGAGECWNTTAPAHLALSYDVVDLVALAAEDLPRPNLITWMAEVERSRRAGELAERVRELGQWLAAEDEPELTKSFDLWLGALGEKWGVELPSIRNYKETSAMLLEKIDRWEAKLRQEGRQLGQQEGELKGRQEGRLEGQQEGELKGRQEGELKGRQEGELKGRLETIDGLLRAGIGWPVIHSATGIDEPTYRAFKRDSANGTEPR